MGGSRGKVEVTERQRERRDNGGELEAEKR